MNRYHHAWTDHPRRYHLKIDTQANNLNAFKVEVMGAYTLIGVRGETLKGLWDAALREADRLRAYAPKVQAANVFQPFAFIIATDLDAIAMEVEYRNLMLIADYGLSHDERVRALCRAADLLQSNPSRLFLFE